jgi:hypothetical protein
MCGGRDAENAFDSSFALVRLFTEDLDREGGLRGKRVRQSVRGRRESVGYKGGSRGGGAVREKYEVGEREEGDAGRDGENSEEGTEPRSCGDSAGERGKRAEKKGFENSRGEESSGWVVE